MRGFSKAIITGNLTRDPELRTTPNGASVCTFSVAVNRIYKDAGGEQREDVSFIDCSAWNRLGEMIAQYAKKGTGVLVSGRLDQRSWEDKTTNQRRSRVEIVVEDFNFVGGGDRSSYGGNNYGGNGYDSNNFGAASTAAPADVASAADSAAASASLGNDQIDLSEVPF